MVSNQSQTVFLSLLLSVATLLATGSLEVAGSPSASASAPAPAPNDAAVAGVPLPLTQVPLTATTMFHGGGGERFYVGQRQLIGSSGSSAKAKSNAIRKDINNDNESDKAENHANAANWSYLNLDRNNSKPLNPHCTVYYTLAKVVCRQLELKSELPYHETYFNSIQHGVFLNTSSQTQIKLADLKVLFPNLVSLSITQSTTADSGSTETSFGHNNNNLLNEIFMLQDEAEYHEYHHHYQPSAIWVNGNGSGNGIIGNGNSNHIPVESSQTQSQSRSSGTASTKPGAADADVGNAARSKPQPPLPVSSSRRKKAIIWPSVKILNLSNNNVDESADEDDEYYNHNNHNHHRNAQDEHNSISISKILNVFPSLEQLELKGNRITTLKNITNQNQLKFIDISDNPLDCTTEEIKWLESSNITLLNLENTLCDRPPHQNKPKPILQTIHLVKKVEEECRVNCSCEIDYIWEQEKVIHSKTSVNCSSRNFSDFPDPDKLPHPTDTLYLNNNHIQSLRKFVYDTRYTNLNVMNLYLDNNQISSLNELEQSDWIYNFQILSLRKNNLTEVHVHLLENIIRLNRWVYQIDLSDNNWHCECRTLSTFKVWLLQHYKFVKNIGNVKCGRTGREIRYLRNEDWCEIEQSKPIIEFLDILNILMGLLIISIIAKVMYDYWNLSRHGKVPWLVGKIW